MRSAVGFFSLLVLGVTSISPTPARAVEEKTVLDLRQTVWRFRLVRATAEYLTAPDTIERVVYRPKKTDVLRGKPALESGDYNVEPAMEYVLPEETAPDWMNPAFDDSQWLRSEGPVGFEDETGKFILARTWFQVTDPRKCPGLKLSVSYRGGLAVYLNGELLLLKDVIPGRTGLDTLGQPYPESAHLRDDGRVLTQADAAKRPEWTRNLERFDIPVNRLRKGPNLLAVAAHRSPLDKVCLLRPNGEGKLLSLGAGGYVGWPTVALSALRLTAPAEAAVTPNIGPHQLSGLCLWNHNAAQNVFTDDVGEGLSPLHPVSMAAPRNGKAMGLVIAGAAGPLRNLAVSASELTGPAVIPASAVCVRFGLPDGRSRTGREEEGSAVTFDTLSNLPPPAIPIHPRTGLAVQPLWITVEIPRDAKPGRYQGALKITAEGLEQREVTLVLKVGSWVLPAPAQRVTHMDIFQSPDSLAMYYGVPMWSSEHLKLLDETFRLLAEVGTKTVYITAVRRTHLGNEHAMVQWIRGHEGQLEPDLGVVETYLDVARRHLGPVPSVILYCWEPPYSMGHAGNPNSPGRQHDRPILLTLKNKQTGQLRAITGPEWGSPESLELWAKLSNALRKILADRGMTDSLLFGLMGDHRPTKEAMTEISNAAPDTKWAVHSHYYCLEHYGFKVGLCSAVWGIGCAPSLPEFGEPGYGWKHPFRLTLNSRYDLRQTSPISTYMTLPEKWMSARASGVKPGQDHPLNGTKGMGRLGADFWPVLKDQRGIARERLCGRYPEAAWGQLSLANCVTALFSPGPNGPLPTVRSEGLRECVQAMEARIFIEKALLDPALATKLDDSLKSQCKRIIENRRRAAYLGGDFYVAADWVERAAHLYELAGEVAARIGL